MDQKKVFQKKFLKNPEINANPQALFSYALNSSKESHWKADGLRDEPFRTFVTVLEIAESGYVLFQNQIAFWYAHGVTVEKDWKLAIRWYKRAIAQGSGISLANLAVHFLGGLGTPVDTKRGIVLLENSIAQKDPKGFFWMGQCYRLGIGQEKSPHQAMRCFKQAKKRGCKEGGYYLKDWDRSGSLGTDEISTCPS